MKKKLLQPLALILLLSACASTHTMRVFKKAAKGTGKAVKETATIPSKIVNPNKYDYDYEQEDNAQKEEANDSYSDYDAMEDEVQEDDANDTSLDVIDENQQNDITEADNDEVGILSVEQTAQDSRLKKPLFPPVDIAKEDIQADDALNAEVMPENDILAVGAMEPVEEPLYWPTNDESEFSEFEVTEDSSDK